jgi:subtilisin family serine protease
MNRRPAWSSLFDADVLRSLQALRPLEEITPEWAWGGSTGKGVKVAVIDSGIDAAHPAIGNVSGYVAITEGSEGLVYNNEPHDDAYGHGTACAGIIRAAAPECELYSVKVLGSTLSTRGPVFASGLRWALDNGMHACNLSLGTPRDFFGALHELSDAAYFRSIMLVAAANNLPIPSYPAMFASVISVASHDVQGNPYLYYYNPQPPVEFGAPGIDVRVAWLEGGWITATGNSFAAPHITGIVARIIGKHPGLTPFQVKVILRALAANVSHDKTGPGEK